MSRNGEAEQSNCRALSNVCDLVFEIWVDIGWDLLIVDKGR